MQSERAHGRLRGLIGWLALLVATGCAPRTRSGPASPLDELRRNPAGLVARIAQIRGLPERRPTPVVFHDADEFAEVVRQKIASHGEAPAAVSDSGVFYSAFGFAEPSLQSGTTPEAVQREQLVAFYDQTTHVVHVREDATREQETAGSTAWIVAHEIGHSLQHQHFTIPDLDKVPDDDSALAALSMLEGDAMLTMIAFIAHDGHVPLKRALVQAQRAAERGELEQYERASGKSRALMAAPAILRERMTFPYLGGMSFMGQLYRAGGFELVNRVYEQPPSTTEQILHVDKYLAGEDAVRVQAPGVPPGFRVLGSGRMGELQLRVALAQCVPRPYAERAASGWGGDSYTLGVSARGLPALLFGSVWDSESDAQEFESAAQVAARCWDASQALGGRFAPPTLVARSGARVAITRGVHPSWSRPVLGAILALPLTARPARAPFGPIQVPPLRPVPPIAADVLVAGSLVAGSFVSERLGIVAPIPPGFMARIETGLVMSHGQPAPSLAAIELSEMVTTPAAMEALFAEFLRGLRKELPDVAVGKGVGEWVRTPLGAALTRSWQLGNGAIVRLLVVPICGGSGSLAISQVWSDPWSEATLTHWVNSLMPRAPGHPPVCAELDP
jgi:hypothetical protein